MSSDSSYKTNIFSEETMEKLREMFGWYEENHPDILQDFREQTHRVTSYVKEMEKEFNINSSAQSEKNGK